MNNPPLRTSPMNSLLEYATHLTRRQFFSRAATGISAAALALVVSAPSALAHDATFHAHEASLHRNEAVLLAAAPSLRAAGVELPVGTPACRLSIRLVDAKTQRPLSGLVRVTRADGSVVVMPGLVNRGVKLRAGHPGKEWFALLEPDTVNVPRETLRIEVIAGLETERASQTLDLRGQETARVTLALERFADPVARGWRNGNTHLHLSGMTRAQADEYLRTIPRADGLELLFVSHLERVDADRDYISNTYTPAEVRALPVPGVRFGWGEEHRHNFGFGGEGFGHVMLLNLRRLIQPVSIGAGITGAGFDYPPLRQGIDQARRDGATVVWCHNTFGFEDIPNWLSGRVHAHNIFDGGSHGSYHDTYYRFLNAGLKVPFSTGTDWFIYDFSRVYARVNGPVTEQSWLAALAAGHTFIANGPLLELTADGHDIGDTIRLNREKTFTVTGRVVGRNDFRKIELIHNGAVIAQAPSRAKGGHFEAELRHPLRVGAPGWIALRVAGGGLDTDGALVTPPTAPVRGSGGARNEMGEVLFGHTSPIYLEFAGRGAFETDAARALIADMENAERTIASQGRFANDAQREEVLTLYRAGAETLRRRLKE